MVADVRKYTADARRYVEAALGNLTPAGARDLARSLIDQAQGFAGQSPGAVAGQVAGQVREVAQQLMEWSQQSRERIMELVQAEVRKQLKAVGIATRDDLDALRRRVRELERGGGTSSAKRSAAKKTTAKRSTAKRSSSTAKRSATKRSTAAKRSGGSRARSSSSSSSTTGGGGA